MGSNRFSLFFVRHSTWLIMLHQHIQRQKAYSSLFTTTKLQCLWCNDFGHYLSSIQLLRQKYTELVLYICISVGKLFLKFQFSNKTHPANSYSTFNKTHFTSMAIKKQRNKILSGHISYLELLHIIKFASAIGIQ